jgi:hypothetical protein
MTEVHFFPAYAQVLDEVVRSAHDQGVIDVECCPGLDPAVVASQLRRYAADTGRPLRCVARRDRVEVHAPHRAGGRPGWARPAGPTESARTST